MKELKKGIRSILSKPSTDHLVISPVQKNIHFIRFSNNSVNRENLYERKVSTSIEAGVNGRTAVLVTDGLCKEELEHTAAQARMTAELMPQDPEYMPPVAKEETEGLKTVSVVPELIPVDERYALLAQIFAKMKNAGLKASGTFVSTIAEHAVFNTRKVALSHYSMEYALNVTALSGNGTFKDFYYGTDLRKLNLEKFTENLIVKASLASKVKSMDAGRYTVVLAPAAVAELMSFFAWYNCDKKKIDEGLCGFSSRINKNIAVSNFHFYSDPYAEGRRLNPPFDAKSGAPCRHVELIKDGRFQEAFCTRYYARQQGLTPCGSGLGNTRYNLTADGTDRTAEQMIADIDNGLFINSFFYIRNVDEMDAVFTGMTRDGVFRIKNGKIVHAVNNFRFNQNMFEMFMNILDIGEAENTEFGRFPYLTVKDFCLVSRTEF